MIGGFAEAEIEQRHRDWMVHHLAAINNKGGHNATAWTIVKAHSQVVAGTNWWFHVKADNG